jgi:hypothetical protein
MYINFEIAQSATLQHVSPPPPSTSPHSKSHDVSLSGGIQNDVCDYYEMVGFDGGDSAVLFG